MNEELGLTLEDMVSIWNTTIEGCKIAYRDEEVPEGATTIHYPTVETFTEVYSVLFLYIGNVIFANNAKLARQLKGRGLL